MFRGFVLSRLVWSTVFCHVRSVVPIRHLKLHLPNFHSSNLWQPIRTVYTMTSFGPVIVAISVRSTDEFSNSGSCRRRCRPSAAFP